MSEDQIDLPDEEDTVEESTSETDEGAGYQGDVVQDILVDGPLAILESEEPDTGPEAADGGETD